MSKALLTSINPKQVELILNGKMTILVSKTAPKLETPFKEYIYCTKEGKGNNLRLHINDMEGRKDVGVATWWRDRKNVLTVNEHLPKYRFNSYLAEGKVVAEFTCNRIVDIEVLDSGAVRNYWNYELDKSCLSIDEIAERIGKEKCGNGLYISDLKVYDQPKELSDFDLSYCRVLNDIECDECPYYDWNSILHSCRKRRLSHPPRSWCYVE